MPDARGLLEWYASYGGIPSQLREHRGVDEDGGLGVVQSLIDDCVVDGRQIRATVTLPRLVVSRSIDEVRTTSPSAAAWVESLSEVDVRARQHIASTTGLGWQPRSRHRVSYVRHTATILRCWVELARAEYPALEVERSRSCYAAQLDAAASVIRLVGDQQRALESGRDWLAASGWLVRMYHQIRTTA